MGFFNRQGRGRTLLLTAALAAAVWSGCGDNTASNPTKYTLQISKNPIDGGTVTRNPDRSAYDAGTRVTVRAAPASGYRFVSWSGVSASTDVEVIVTMEADLTLTANFQQQTGHVHDWGDWVVTTPATCEAAGVETRTCKLDGSHKDTRAIAKLTGTSCNPNHVHDWGDWVVTTPATCEAAGMETRTCKLDANHKETQTIPKLTGSSCNSGGGSSETVSLGGLKWMTKNLNVQTAESWCYGEGGQVYDYEVDNFVTLTPSQVQANCDKYGRLYTWSAAKTACQLVGMRLPTREEWNALVTAAGGASTAGSKLKSSTGWNSYSGVSSTDEFQFSALPGGYRGSVGNFNNAGRNGYWWTATEDSEGYAYNRYMNYYRDRVYEDFHDKSDGFSARCVQD